MLRPRLSVHDWTLILTDESDPHCGMIPGGDETEQGPRAERVRTAARILVMREYNYFNMPLNNGTVEGLNNKAKVISHKAYGFRTAKNYIRNLYHCMA